VLDLAYIALPGGCRALRNRGRTFNIDLVNKLEADSRAAKLHAIGKPAI
jgi:hypothetical protein